MQTKAKVNEIFGDRPIFDPQPRHPHFRFCYFVDESRPLPSDWNIRFQNTERFNINLCRDADGFKHALNSCEAQPFIVSLPGDQPHIREAAMQLLAERYPDVTPLYHGPPPISPYKMGEWYWIKGELRRQPAQADLDSRLHDRRVWQKHGFDKPRKGMYIGQRRLTNGYISTDTGEYDDLVHLYQPEDPFMAYLFVTSQHANPLRAVQTQVSEYEVK